MVIKVDFGLLIALECVYFLFPGLRYKNKIHMWIIFIQIFLQCSHKNTSSYIFNINYDKNPTMNDSYLGFNKFERFIYFKGTMGYLVQEF